VSEENKKPEIVAGEKMVKNCPLCGGKFIEILPLNVWHICPVEGGCGLSFLVMNKA